MPFRSVFSSGNDSGDVRIVEKVGLLFRRKPPRYSFAAGDLAFVTLRRFLRRLDMPSTEPWQR